MAKNIKVTELQQRYLKLATTFISFFIYTMYLCVKEGTHEGSCHNDLRSVEAANRLLD